MKRIALPMTAVLILLASADAGAATPTAGVFRGVTSQKDTGFALEVERRPNGRMRVEGVQVGFRMNCEDGSSVARTTYLGGAKLRRGGRFKIAESSEGNYGSRGSIRLTVRMRGRFTANHSAQGTFSASAKNSESANHPAVACYAGPVGWTAAR
jgi:hypothetical protein